MNYTIEKLPDEPIVIWTPSPEFSYIGDELKESDNAARALWDASPDQIYFIADLSQSRVTFSNLVAATADVLYGELSLWNHPKLKLIIAVSQEATVKLVADNVLQNSDKPGLYTLNKPIFVMDSREKALAFIRDQLRSQ